MVVSFALICFDLLSVPSHDRTTFASSRLAEIALQAQDEAADLQRQLQDLQEKQQRGEDVSGTDSGLGEGAGAGAIGDGAAPRGRELEFEIMKWESEVDFLPPPSNGEDDGISATGTDGSVYCKYSRVRVCLRWYRAVQTERKMLQYGFVSEYNLSLEQPFLNPLERISSAFLDFYRC